MDLNKWANLWKKCPELQPRHCDSPGCGLLLCFAIVDDGKEHDNIVLWARPDILRMQCGMVNRERDGNMFENPHTAEALIRDRAILVGGEKFSLKLEPDFYGSPVCKWWCSRNYEFLANSDDPTEALYLAWCRILEIDP